MLHCSLIAACGECILQTVIQNKVIRQETMGSHGHDCGKKHGVLITCNEKDLSFAKIEDCIPRGSHLPDPNVPHSRREGNCGLCNRHATHSQMEGDLKKQYLLSVKHVPNIGFHMRPFL